MLIGDIDISRLILCIQQLEEEKMKDIEEYRNTKAKTQNKCGQQNGGLSLTQFQKSNGHAPSSTSAPTPKKSR